MWNTNMPKHGHVVQYLIFHKASLMLQNTKNKRLHVCQKIEILDLDFPIHILHRDSIKSSKPQSNPTSSEKIWLKHLNLKRKEKRIWKSKQRKRLNCAIKHQCRNKNFAMEKINGVFLCRMQMLHFIAKSTWQKSIVFIYLLFSGSVLSIACLVLVNHLQYKVDPVIFFIQQFKKKCCCFCCCCCCLVTKWVHTIKLKNYMSVQILPKWVFV